MREKGRKRKGGRERERQTGEKGKKVRQELKGRGIVSECLEERERKEGKEKIKMLKE